MLAVAEASDPSLSHPYPFDVPGAQTQDYRRLAGPGPDRAGPRSARAAYPITAQRKAAR